MVKWKMRYLIDKITFATNLTAIIKTQLKIVLTSLALAAGVLGWFGAETIYSEIQSKPRRAAMQQICDQGTVNVTGEITSLNLPDPNDSLFDYNNRFMVGYVTIGVDEGRIHKGLLIADRVLPTVVEIPSDYYFDILDKAQLPKRPEGDISIDGICENLREYNAFVIRPTMVTFHSFNTVCERDLEGFVCSGPYSTK